MVLNKDFKEFIQLLNGHDVHYLIVGGYAVAFHGYPRYTKDIDLWILREKRNANKLLKVLDDFGFSSLKLNAEDFLDPNQVVQLGYPPNRIDIRILQNAFFIVILRFYALCYRNENSCNPIHVKNSHS